MDKIKVILVEDQELLLDGLSLSLDADESLEVLGKIKDIDEVLNCKQCKDADILLTDICTANGHNSLDYVVKIKSNFPQIKIVLMTSIMEIDFIDRAKQSGADSFVYKTMPTKELIAVIKNVMNGYSTFPLSKKEELPELKDLTNNELSYTEGYALKEDFSFAMVFYGAEPNDEILTMKTGSDNELDISVIYRVGNFGVDYLMCQYELRVTTRWRTSVYYSNIIDLPEYDDKIGVLITRENNYYNIEIINFGGSSNEFDKTKIYYLDGDGMYLVNEDDNYLVMDK